MESFIMWIVYFDGYIGNYLFGVGCYYDYV